MIYANRLRCLFEYQDDGALIWRVRPASDFSSARKAGWWNRNYAGKRAGWETARGYWAITIDGVQHQAHRLVWEYHNGLIPSYPKAEIDHINGNKLDNRIENLRVVSRPENNRNAALRTDNTSGVCGVSFEGRYGKWSARIRANGRQVYLGLY